MNVTIRRATQDDIDFVAGLVAHEDVEPFLAAARPKDRAALVEDVERSESEPERFGVFTALLCPRCGPDVAQRVSEAAS